VNSQSCKIAQTKREEVVLMHLKLKCYINHIFLICTHKTQHNLDMGGITTFILIIDSIVSYGAIINSKIFLKFPKWGFPKLSIYEPCNFGGL